MAQVASARTGDGLDLRVEDLLNEAPSAASDRCRAFFEREVVDFDRLFVLGHGAIASRLERALGAAGIQALGILDIDSLEWEERLEAKSFPKTLNGVDTSPWDSFIATRCDRFWPPSPPHWYDPIRNPILPFVAGCWAFASAFENVLPFYPPDRILEQADQVRRAWLRLDDLASRNLVVTLLERSLGRSYGLTEFASASSHRSHRGRTASPLAATGPTFADLGDVTGVVFDFCGPQDRWFEHCLGRSDGRSLRYLRHSLHPDADARIPVSVAHSLGERAEIVPAWLWPPTWLSEVRLAANDAGGLEASTATSADEHAALLWQSIHDLKLEWKKRWTSSSSDIEFPVDVDADEKNESLAEARELGRSVWRSLHGLPTKESAQLRIRQRPWEPFAPDLAAEILRLLAGHPKMRLHWESANVLQILAAWGERAELEDRRIVLNESAHPDMGVLLIDRAGRAPNDSLG